MSTSCPWARHLRCAARLGEPRRLIADLRGLAPPQLTGRQCAAAPLGSRASSGSYRAACRQHPVADGPLLQGVDLDGHRVLDTVDVPRQRVVQRAEETLHRVTEERDEVVERDIVGGGAAAGRR